MQHESWLRFDRLCSPLVQISELFFRLNVALRNSGVRLSAAPHCAEMYRQKTSPDAAKMFRQFAAHKGSARALLGSADAAVLLAYGLGGDPGMAASVLNPHLSQVHLEDRIPVNES